MLRIAIVLALLPGCRQLLGFDEVVATGDPDGRPPADSGEDAPADASLCFGTFETICLDAAPTDDIEVATGTTTTMSTDVCADISSQTTVDACVIAGRNVTIEGTLRALGTRPVVLIATGTLTLSGLLDVASRGDFVSGDRGAGAIACAPATTPTQGARGGGSGGSLVARGGNGGNGGGGLGGAAGPTILIDSLPLRGGCSGTDGVGVVIALPGLGGGAVFAIASSMMIAGTINASGSGGDGATNDGGGGGGGSGGMIVLEASSAIEISGTLIAQGGGGGGGTANNAVAGRGGEPDATFPGLPAVGGVNGDGAGDGGAGGTSGVGQLGENGGGKGGGGGGGATGFIRLTAASVDLDGIASPAAM